MSSDGPEHGSGDPAGSSLRSSKPAPSASSSTKARPVGAVARELDLTETALRDWVQHAQAERTQGKTG